MKIEIYNATGQLVRQYDAGTNHVFTLAVDVPAGVYLLKAKATDMTQNARLVVEK